MSFRPQTPHISDPHLTITPSHIYIKAPAHLSELKKVVKDVYAYFHSPRAYAFDAPKAVIISGTHPSHHLLSTAFTKMEINSFLDHSAQTDHSIEHRTDYDNHAVFEEFSFLMDTLTSRMKVIHSFEFDVVNYHDGCTSDPIFAAFVHGLPSLIRRQDLVRLKISAKTVPSNVELFSSMCRNVMSQIEVTVSRPITEQVKIALTIVGGAGDTPPYANAKQQYMAKAREISAAKKDGVVDISFCEEPSDVDRT
ncbi:hypothetical protein CVT24_001426 [Panaeolus cyanescens]|uniref:Uncharacterized protein n=1 Tax=Panaeolus cyanescens TaxID=181874 RepID=A0A409YU31_9AGAR|nr:hypothetical protein CVT24_001426 [Panaeolus cyanescens]